MSMSSQVEQIKSRLNIVDVVGSYIKLQKAGINLKAVCPFHHEKTPSFFVSPSRDTWHCFGCNRGGDIFSFVMEIEGVEFLEALKILADRAGVELKPVSQEERSERSRLLKIIELSKDFYQDELKKNKEVIEYLKKRGLEDATVKEFGIGFVPDGWRNLYDFLKNKNCSDSDMEKTGMIIRKSPVVSGQSSVYDRFRSRIMFPLENSAGQAIGFSARIFYLETESPSRDSVSKSEPAKYINTPQTILYDKSKFLYAFDKAKIEIRKKDQCILVEGQMDAIMSHQAGVKNAVAVSGTALTIDHLRIIKRLTNNLAIAFDKDEAGLNASKRGIDMALAEEFDVKAIVMPSGKDPADAIKEDKKSWEKAIKESKHIIDFYLGIFLEKNYDPRELKKKVKENILPYVALIPDEIEKAHWVGEIAKHLNIKEEPIWKEINNISLPSYEIRRDEGIVSEEIKRKTRYDIIREQLIGFIIWQNSSQDKDLKKMLSDCQKRYKLKFDEENQNEKRMAFVAELLCGNMEDLKKELEKLMIEFEKEIIKAQREETALKIRQAENSNNQEQLAEYLNEFNELNKKLKNIT